MLIPNNELIKWVQFQSNRANARNHKHIRETIDTFQHTGIVADSNSESSKRIQNIVSSHRTIITEKAYMELSEVVIFGIDSPYCDAFPIPSNNIPKIIIFDGLLYLIRFYVDLIITLDLLESSNIKDTIKVSGEELPFSLAMSLAGHVILTEGIDNDHQSLGLANALGENARVRAERGYSAAALFYVLHELGHLSCGHLNNGFISERLSIEPAIDQDINNKQLMEFEADTYALNSIQSSVRNPIISSVIFALAPFAFLETFRGGLNKGHPLTVNRIAALADHIVFHDEPELASALQNIVESEVNRFNRLSDSRLANGGNIQYRIQENMSLKEAYSTMKDVGYYIKTKFGQLDFS